MQSVLLVVDDRPIRQKLSALLVEAGFSVLVAGQGAEGVAVAQEKSPDAILLDLCLPALDGVETCRRLRSMPQFSHTAILLITGRKEIEGQVNPFELGADDYLGRPVEAGDLLLRLEEALRRREGGGAGERLGRELLAVRQEAALLRQTGESLQAANERLCRIDQARTEFLNTAAHELRIPVTILNGYLSLLQEMGTENFTAEQKEYLMVALDNSDRMVDLTNNMLDLSRLEAGKMVMEIGGYDLGSTVRDVFRDFRPLAARGGVALEIDPVGPCPALFDQDQIRRVLANLLTNAIKFTPAGGRVQIRLAHTDREAQVAVEDTGQGIPPERIAELFEEFVQLHQHDSRKGTGLGLAICKRIIDSHQGRIWVESTLGEGSRFIFTLPRSA